MHGKKMVAPIVVSVIVILILLAWSVSLIIFGSVGLFVKILVSIISIALIGVVIFVLAERIKEIRSGDEDDLSKY